MSFWNGVHMQINVFVHEADEKNEVAPDWFKIERFSTALKNKFYSNIEKLVKFLKFQSKFEVYLLLYQLFYLYFII